MKTFRLGVVFMFSGTVDVKAENMSEAFKIARSDVCAGLKDIYTENENVVTWDVDVHSYETQPTGHVLEV